MPEAVPLREMSGANLAEREGFEPPCRLPDKTLSRRPRYDHFGTSPVVGRSALTRTVRLRLSGEGPQSRTLRPPVRSMSHTGTFDYTARSAGRKLPPSPAQAGQANLIHSPRQCHKVWPR